MTRRVAADLVMGLGLAGLAIGIGLACSETPAPAEPEPIAVSQDPGPCLDTPPPQGEADLLSPGESWCPERAGACVRRRDLTLLIRAIAYGRTAWTKCGPLPADGGPEAGPEEL